MTHLTQQDNQESVVDHAPPELVARLQSTVERAGGLPQWEQTRLRLRWNGYTATIWPYYGDNWTVYIQNDRRGPKGRVIANAVPFDTAQSMAERWMLQKQADHD